MMAHDSARPSDLASTPATQSLPTLVAKTVEYSDRPDRRTIYPPGLTGLDRMERWLTATTDAFVDLETWR